MDAESEDYYNFLLLEYRGRQGSFWYACSSHVLVPMQNFNLNLPYLRYEFGWYNLEMDAWVNHEMDAWVNLN